MPNDDARRGSPFESTTDERIPRQNIMPGGLPPPRVPFPGADAPLPGPSTPGTRGPIPTLPAPPPQPAQELFPIPPLRRG